MNYTDVAKILARDDESLEESKRADEKLLKRYEKLIPMFDLMKKLSDIIRKERHKRGSIDFDVAETKIIADENHKPVEIKAYDRNPATKLIEDFMLMANETVAEDYFWQEIPFEYRTHESPDQEKIENLMFFMSSFGIYMRPSKDEVHPKELQKVLEKIEGEPYEALISKMMLRSMKQARYSTECSGHFGLSCKYYCHFTSPIRRYPDLQIHRIIKENLHGELDSKRIGHYKTILPRIADDNSLKERRAEEAEREVIKLKEIEYMSERIGEEYDGVVSGVTANYIFVELENTVEGAVAVAYMRDDYYYFNEEEYAMVGENTGKRYQLGDKVKVKVLSCDKIKKTIDFTMVDEE
jgi:ribonuclease R